MGATWTKRVRAATMNSRTLSPCVASITGWQKHIALPRQSFKQSWRSITVTNTKAFSLGPLDFWRQDNMDDKQMNDEDINKVFQQSAERESAAWELFLERFDKQFPMPEIANVRLMQAIGWQFILIMIQSVFAIILAALRTSDMFYTAASASNILVKWGDAISAVVAVEFGIVVFATIK